MYYLKINLSKYLILLIVLLLQACSVAMAAKGHKDPDLTVIKNGANKNEIEKQLGQAIELHPKDNTTVCLYEYELGQESDPPSAIYHAALDTMTLGVWEIIGTGVEIALRGEKRRVEIIYNNQNKVIDFKSVPLPKKEKKKEENF